MGPTDGAAWFASQLRTTLRARAAWAIAGVAATTVLFARALDLFAFTPEPERAATLGLETGTLFSVLYLAGSCGTLAGLRETDDGWSQALRSSQAGTALIWWGSWAARWTVALSIALLCLLTTLGVSIYMGQVVRVDPVAGLSALAAITLAGVGGAAAALWAGPAVGGCVAGALILFPAWGAAAAPSLLAPPLPGIASTAADFVRSAALTCAAGAFAQAGLRRLEG